jgi:hypothetical protein
MSELEEAERFLRKVESDTKTIRYCYGRAELFNEALKIYRKIGDGKRKTEMIWEILLFQLRFLTILEERKSLNRRFAPMVEYANGTVYPDIRTFTDPQIDYYKARARITSNLIHKARYNDIVWELKKDHAYGREAIYAYLQCVGVYYDNDWQNEIADSLLRAVELALTLNDQTAIDAVKKDLFHWIEILAKTGKFRWCLELIDAALEMKRYLQNNELEICVDIAKSAAGFYANVKDGYNLQQSFLKKLVVLMNTLKKPKEALSFMEQIAESFVEEGNWKLNNYPSGDLVAAFFYEMAAKMYRDLGRKEKSNELMKKVKTHTEKAEVGFMEIKASVEIPNQPLRDYIASLESLSLPDALKKIALEDSFVPNLSRIRSELERQKGKSLALVIPRVSIRDGNPVLRSQTESDILQDNLVERVVLEYKIYGSLIGEILNELVQKKSLNHGSLLSFLVSSPVFERSSQKLLEVGLERYFFGDYVSCLHVLTPQLESALRQMMGKLGVPTTMIDGDAIEEKPLGNVLRERKMKELLGEDISFYISCVFEDKRGDNLRNDIAHGLISEEACTRNTADIVLHIFLLLTRFRT